MSGNTRIIKLRAKCDARSSQSSGLALDGIDALTLSYLRYLSPTASVITASSPACSGAGKNHPLAAGTPKRRFTRATDIADPSRNFVYTEQRREQKNMRRFCVAQHDTITLGAPIRRRRRRRTTGIAKVNAGNARTLTSPPSLFGVPMSASLQPLAAT